MSGARVSVVATTVVGLLEGCQVAKICPIEVHGHAAITAARTDDRDRGCTQCSRPLPWIVLTSMIRSPMLAKKAPRGAGVVRFGGDLKGKTSMVQWEIPRPPTSLSVLVDLGVELGVPATACLAGTGLTENSLREVGTEVTARQEQSAIRNLLIATNSRNHLGLKAGSRFHLTSFGFWGFALVSSPTLGGALNVALQFLDLTYAWSQFDLRRVGDEAQLVLDVTDVPEPLRRFAIERDLAVTVALQRELFNAQVVPLRLMLAFPPRDLDHYEQVLGISPEFAGNETFLAIDAAMLDLPMPQADAHTQALAQEQCRKLLEHNNARTGVAGRVRDLLLARLGDPPTAENIARQLLMSSRTLRERLSGEGTSYRELLDEVRERLAEEMFAGGLTVAQTAERLGYLEVSSFSHAFRRWKGVGPRAYRTSETALTRRSPNMTSSAQTKT